MPNVYRSPRSKGEPGKTNYLGVGGTDGVFIRPRPGRKVGASIEDIRDGTGNTIMIVEVPDDSAVVWTRPSDFTPDADNPLNGLIGLHPGGFQACLANGSVRFLSDSIDLNLINALFTKAGGEVVELE